MMDMNMIDEVNNIRIAYENAKAQNVGVAQARTRYANVLITHGEELILAAKNLADTEKQLGLLREETDALAAALADSDDELKRLKEQNGKKKKNETK